MRPFFRLMPLLLLSGCAASSYCEGEHDYQMARSVATLKSAEGLKLPESSSALKIPPATKQNAPYAETRTDEDGDDYTVCLDMPPAMPVVAEPKPAAPTAAPGPAAAPAPPPAPAEEPKS